MIELEVLGPPRITRDGASVPLPPKPLALLSYLCLTEPLGFQRRETIRSVFWPDLESSRAAAELRPPVSTLQRTLGRRVVLTRGDGEVGLDLNRIRCDAWEFDGAIAEGDFDRAVSLYHGQLLQGFDLGDTPEFESWLDGQRAPRRQAFQEALETLAARALAEGKPRDAVDHLHRLFKIDPTRVRTAVLLMRALETANDRAEAIRIGEQHARAVRRELGTGPEARIVTMLDRLRSDPASVETPHLTPAATPDDEGVITAPLDIDEPRPAANLSDHLRAALGARYELRGEIGHGGMSRVFLATDLKLSRQVAVKVLLPELSATIATERFLSEIEILASLKHPNVLPLFDAGEAGRSLYYVMPYVEGESLRERVRREHQLKLDDAMVVARDVAKALDYAHRRGIVHRDIKPANILLADGNAIVADFGIAKAIDASGGGTTEPGLAIGTPNYMSPEQASGSAALDGRSDVYALGCVMYEMLAGEPPFTGPNARAIIARQIQEPPPPLGVVRPDLPAAVVASVEKALAKSPAGRYDTAPDFVTAVEAAARGEPLKPPPQSARQGTRYATAAIVAAVIAIGIHVAGRDRKPILDDNRVLLFPMREIGFSRLQPGLGEIAALRISSALEATEPFKTVWGGALVPDSVLRLHTGAADSLGQDRRTRYRFDAEIVEAGNEASVILRLYDVRGDSLVRQHTEAGRLGTEAVMATALRAASELLPFLVEPGREVDRTAFRDRDLGAAVLWMQGEREYRRARFLSALTFYERAIDRDSSLAMAALKGAQAASWRLEPERAIALLDLVLSTPGALPQRHRQFARALLHFQRGEADLATAELQRVLVQDTAWTDAWMALGDVYYHLLPSSSGLDSMAESAFLAALRLDSAFSPAAAHLAQIAIRRGHVDRAERLLSRFAAHTTDSVTKTQMSLALSCVKSAEPQRWHGADAVAPIVLLGTAFSLTGGLTQAACAESAYRAVLARDSVPPNIEWAALSGLHSILIASERYEEARQLLGEALEMGYSGAYALYVLDDVLGAPFGRESEAAASLARRAAGDAYGRAGTETQWALGLWHVSRGDTATAAAIQSNLQSAAEEEGTHTALLARALRAHLLIGVDSGTALDSLRALRTKATKKELEWEISKSLGFERLAQAELALARGLYREALATASTFDHAMIGPYAMFVGRSLRIRIKAARGLGLDDAAAQYESRLEQLQGHSETGTR